MHSRVILNPAIAEKFLFRGNAMTKVFNINSIPDKFTDDPKFESAMCTKYLGALAGSDKIYVNIDSLKPGAKSAKYHSHSIKEEFFLILSGHGSLRIKDEIFAVQKGDFLAKPAGKGIAHQFINDGDEVLEILDCGLNDENDVVEYPDEGTFLLKGKAFRKNSAINGWTSEPNK